MRGKMQRKFLKIICVADFNINSNSNLSTNVNVVSNPDTELTKFIPGGCTRCLGFDLIDRYVKALRRPAEAWEGRGKWLEAGRDLRGFSRRCGGVAG